MTRSAGSGQAYRDALRRARESLGSLFSRAKALKGEEAVRALYDALLSSDVGVTAARDLLKDMPTDGAEAILRERLMALMTQCEKRLAPDAAGVRPYVILVLGVNGVGKTTTIGKLAKRFRDQGKKPILAAGDTFRAAGIEQLALWARMSGADLIKGIPGGDASAVIYDAVKAAVFRGADIVIADTAGRQHTKTDLMEELRKVKRAVGKALPGAPHETLLVLDAGTGQNAVSQAREFHSALGLTGLIMTKLDGTARGGTLVGIIRDLSLPVAYVGLGEGIDDLMEFNAREYVSALF